MKKQHKIIYSFILIITILSIGSILIFSKKINTQNKERKSELIAQVIAQDFKTVTVEDQQNIIYTFPKSNQEFQLGSNIIIEYSGNIDKNKSIQKNKIIKHEKIERNNTTIPQTFQDNGIFKNFYTQAYEKLNTMTLQEKISQILLVRYPDSKGIDTLKEYQFGGYVFFEKDFKNKTEQEVKTMIKSLQTASKIPILTAVDEEGGKVVRISSNPNLTNERFKSSKELYDLGGFAKIKEDTFEKSKALYNLGLNLNLAPVVDVSTNPSDYMYERSFGKDTFLTKEYAKKVIEASKKTDVSYTLKHFPGYGNNNDTHTGMVIDRRSYDDILKNDIPPFQAGIDSGAETVLISHNIIQNIDEKNPASLSPSVHNLLRNELGFTGIIITDDMEMEAISSIQNATLKAILAGNDIIITTDYKNSFNSIENAIKNELISEQLINKLAFRILSWKYYKGLIK